MPTMGRRILMTEYCSVPPTTTPSIRAHSKSKWLMGCPGSERASTPTTTAPGNQRAETACSRQLPDRHVALHGDSGQQRDILVNGATSELTDSRADRLVATDAERQSLSNDRRAPFGVLTASRVHFTRRPKASCYWANDRAERSCLLLWCRAAQRVTEGG